MKQKLLNFSRLRSLLLLVCVMLGMSAWGETFTYTLTISASDFNTTSYAANNNEKTSNAVCTTDNTKTYEVHWTSNQVMKNGNNIQWQKNNGYIYNSTDLGTINSVTVNSSAGSFTTYYGTSEHPTSGTTVGNGFFTTVVGSATGTTSSVVVTFTITEGSTPPTPTNPTVNTGTLTHVTSLDMWYFDTDVVNIANGGQVAAETEVFVQPNVESGYELASITAVDANNTTVTLTENSGNWSFIMPNSNVTISATASEIQSLSTIDITGMTSPLTFSPGDFTASGTGYNSYDNVTFTGSNNVNYGGWTLERVMHSGNNMQMEKNDGRVTLPTIVSSNGFTITVTATTNSVIVSDGTNSGTNELTVGSTNTNITISTGSSYAVISQITITVAPPVHTARFFINGTELTTAEVEVSEGAAITFPADPEDIGAKVFVGWTTAEITGEQDEAPATLVNSAIMGEANVTYYAVFATIESASTTTTTTDLLNRETTGVTGTSYSDWSGKTASSSAVYAGNSAGGSESIQLRSNNNNSGVISTTSGGKLGSVTVVWNSVTETGRTINIYGKNSAYSAASDLYNTNNQGTLLGTITKGTSTSLTIVGDYEYVGIRSASGALYLTSISIVWESGTPATYSGYCTTVKTAPEFTYATASYTVGYDASFETPVLTKPNDLDATQISYSISQNEGVATINATTGAVTIGNNAGTVTVTATFAGDNRYLPATASYTITVEPKVAITMNADGIRTYASAYGLDFSQVEGLTAYYATGYDKTNLSLTMTPMDVTAPGAGMMLKGAANQTYTVPVATSGSTTTTQYLVGLTEATNVPQVDAEGNTTFILAKVNDVINWYKLREENYTLKANSAYLRLPADAIPQGQNPVVMDFTGGSNGISSATSTAINNESWYTLDGRLLQSKPSTKGIYVNNGRKIVIK